MEIVLKGVCMEFITTKKTMRYGENGLSIALPKGWIQSCEVGKGQEINIYQDDEKLIISLDPIEGPEVKKPKSIDELLAELNTPPEKRARMEVVLNQLLGTKKKPVGREGRVTPD